MLNLMYITNRPEIAKIAEKAGVDRIFVDMEYIGKDERQAGLDTVKSHHTIDDIKRIRDAVSDSEVLVRVNPIHRATTQYSDSYDEIRSAIDAGAGVVMLPMYRTMGEVETFLHIVDGKARTQLLTETPDACSIMNQVVAIPEVDEIHIGLNDLHLAYHKSFMFELLVDGTVDTLCNQLRGSGKRFGFGGIARIGYGMLPAEYVIKEHYRLGSTCAILSRAFCNVAKMSDLTEIDNLFKIEMARIRETEHIAISMSEEELDQNHIFVQQLVDSIVKAMRGANYGT